MLFLYYNNKHCKLFCITYHKNNIAVYTQYETITVSLIYNSYKYIFLYSFTVLYVYFFLTVGPLSSSSCDLSSNNSASGMYRVSSYSSLCSWTVMLTPSGKAVCNTSKRTEPTVDGRCITCERKSTLLKS